MAGKPGRSGTNKGKDRMWSEAIRRAVNRTTSDGKTKRLDALASKLITKGLKGDTSALREIGDRLDGKPPQAIVGDAGADPIQTVTRLEIVAAGDVSNGKD